MKDLDERVLGYCWFSNGGGSIGIVVCAIPYKGMRAYMMHIGDPTDHSNDIRRIMDSGSKIPVLEAVSLVNNVGIWEYPNLGKNIEAISAQDLFLDMRLKDSGNLLVRLASKPKGSYESGGEVLRSAKSPAIHRPSKKT